MVSLTLVINALSAIVLIFTVVGTVVGFWRGSLQKYLQRTLGINDMKDKWDSVDAGVRGLREDHEEVREDLRTIKEAQLDIGEAINEDETVDVTELEERHFGDDVRSGDFLRGANSRPRDRG